LLSVFVNSHCPVIEANNDDTPERPVSQRPITLHIQFGLNKCTVCNIKAPTRKPIGRWTKKGWRGRFIAKN